MLCPECRNETRSKNKGLIRHRICRSCGYEFTTIEVLYEPMSTKEKLIKFMRDRKRNTDTATLSAYFMVASKTINRLMRELELEGKVTSNKGKGGKNIWQWNHSVALPAKPAPVQHRVEPAPVVGQRTKVTTSYPHIRGYDD